MSISVPSLLLSSRLMASRSFILAYRFLKASRTVFGYPLPAPSLLESPPSTLIVDRLLVIIISGTDSLADIFLY